MCTIQGFTVFGLCESSKGRIDKLTKINGFQGPFAMLKTSTQKLPNVSLPEDIITLKQFFIKICLFMNKKLIICINVLPIVYPVGGKTEWTVLKTICQCGIDPDRHTLLIILL